MGELNLDSIDRALMTVRPSPVRSRRGTSCVAGRTATQLSFDLLLVPDSSFPEERSAASNCRMDGGQPVMGS